MALMPTIYKINPTRIMETLLKTDFFNIMHDNFSPGKNTGHLKKMYTDFILTLFAFCQSEGDKANLFLILNYIRIEFVSIQNKEIEYTSGKKMRSFITCLKQLK
jgi:hypothetical protein